MKTEETLSMVVEANQHAGICSRALIIYVTGKTNDESSRQEEEAFLPLFKEEMGIGDDVHEADYPFDDLFIHRFVDHGDIAMDELSELSDDAESLHIFLSRLPTKDEWASLKQRAFAFENVWERLGKYSDGLKITGVRLIKTTTTVIEEEISL